MEYLEATHESPAAAAEAWAVERAHVHYYVRKLVNAGVPRSERTDASAQSRAPSPVLEEQESDSYKVWCQAWAFAAELRATHGKRATARLVSERFGIKFSVSSAARAQSQPTPPCKRGRKLSIPEEVEVKLEDLCLALRELNLPVFRFMVLNYVNVLVSGTAIAEQLKDREVKRGWYYWWLGRCARLKTANLTPLEVTAEDGSCSGSDSDDLADE